MVGEGRRNQKRNAGRGTGETVPIMKGATPNFTLRDEGVRRECRDSNVCWGKKNSWHPGEKDPARSKDHGGPNCIRKMDA